MLVIVAARPTEVACRFAANGATPYQRQAIHTEYTMRTVPSSRVVSVLDSGAEGPGFKSQPRRCRGNSLSQLFTPIVP